MPARTHPQTPRRTHAAAPARAPDRLSRAGVTFLWIMAGGVVTLFVGALALSVHAEYTARAEALRQRQAAAAAAAARAAATPPPRSFSQAVLDAIERYRVEVHQPHLEAERRAEAERMAKAAREQAERRLQAERRATTDVSP